MDLNTICFYGRPQRLRIDACGDAWLVRAWGWLYEADTLIEAVGLADTLDPGLPMEPPTPDRLYS